MFLFHQSGPSTPKREVYENIQLAATEDRDVANYQELGNRPFEAPSIYTSVSQVGVEKGDLNYQNISSKNAARTQTDETCTYEDVK